MGNSFRFKRFAVGQDGAAMKVGTDGVLLGAWCSVEPGMRRALDIGAGTGVVALMVAQRGEKHLQRVDAVEIDGDGFRRAARNAAASPWNGILHVVHSSVQDFYRGRSGEGKYDLIVSNPPYFTNSLQAPDALRNMARHTLQLSHADLAGCAAGMLSPGGRFAVVLPHAEAGKFVGLSAKAGLYLARRTDVHPTPSSGPKRALLEFGFDRHDGDITAEELVIEAAPLQYTPQYMRLTGDFYLKF